MRRLYLSLLIAITIMQSALCELNSVSSSSLQISDLGQLSKIATTLDDNVDIVGILHGTGHANVMAGNFVDKVKFVDLKELAATGPGGKNGFIVAYNDGADQVLAQTVIPEVIISKLSKRGELYVITGKALTDGIWCGETTITEGPFSAQFELKEGAFTCKSIVQSECTSVFANEAGVYAEQCFGERDAKKIDVKVGSETIPLVYESSTIYLSHLVKSGANYILIGAYEGPGKITLSTTKKAAESKTLTLASTKNGLFAILIQGSKAVDGLDLVLGQQVVATSFVQVTGDRVIVAGVIEGDGADIEVSGAHMVNVAGNGVLLFDLVPQQNALANTWAVAYPFNAKLRDVFVLNNYVFLYHDQVASSIPLFNIRNVAVSVLDLTSDNEFTFVHRVSENNLTAGAIAVDGEALLLTAVNNNRGSLELMFSETALPEFMTREPIVEPPKSTSPPPTPLPDNKPPTPDIKPPPLPENKPVAPPVAQTNPPPPNDKPVSQPVAETVTPKEPEKVPQAEPKPEVVKDNSATFSTSYVVIAVVVLVVFLAYVGFRFWKQQKAERQRQYGRVRMEDRIREENEFYNP